MTARIDGDFVVFLIGMRVNKLWKPWKWMPVAVQMSRELVSDLAVVAEVKQLEGAPNIVKSGELSVYVTDARRFGISMLLATGSRRHLEVLGLRAADKGMVAVH